MQDDILIRRAAAKDAAPLSSSCRYHRGSRFINICYRMAGNADDALDLSQEVFRLWRTLEQYQFDAAFSHLAVPADVCIDFLRGSTCLAALRR